MVCLEDLYGLFDVRTAFYNAVWGAGINSRNIDSAVAFHIRLMVSCSCCCERGLSEAAAALRS